MKIISFIHKCYSYINNHKVGFWAIVLLKGISIITSIVIAFCMSRIIALISMTDIRHLMMYILVLATTYGISLICQYISFALYQKVEKDTRIELKKVILDNMLHSFSLNQGERQSINSAKANEILYADANNITTLLFATVDLLTGGFTIILTGVLLFSINISLALILTVIFVFAALFVFNYSKVLKRINIKLREETDVHFKLTRDILKSIKYICLSNSSDFHFERYTDNLDKVKKSTKYRDKAAWRLGYLSSIMGYAWTIIFLCIGAKLLSLDQLDVSDFILFFSYSRIYSTGITNILNQYSDLQQMTVSVERVFDLLKIYRKEDEKLKVDFPKELNSIIISNLDFSYGEHKVISALNKKVNFNAILVTGNNGKGKTTFLNILSGILSPQGGTVLYNDMPVENISFKSLCNSISYASQGDLIFDMSIKDNILSFAGNEAISDEKLADICKKVGILNDILDLEKNFDTQISEIRDFSFGQKKKMLLVRACLRPSQIILFDEPLEGLDESSQKLVVNLISTITEEKYVFIATHKPEQFVFCKDTIML